MATFEQRVLALQCQEEAHDKKPIIMVCFKADCKKRKSCLTCIDQFHNDHKDQLALIADIEEFIHKNSVALQGSSTANTIINTFNELKQKVLQHLNVLEVVLKEKVSQVFTKINDPNKLQQEGDFNEDQQAFINLQDKFLKQVQISSGEIYSNFSNLRKLFCPLEIKVERLESAEKAANQRINEKTIYASTFKCNESVFLKGFYQPQILSKQDEVNQLAYAIYLGKDLKQQILSFTVDINHKEMLKQDCYYINCPQVLKLKSDEEYTITVASGKELDLQKYTGIGLENPFIKFTDKEEAFQPLGDKKIVCESEKGQFASFVLGVD